MALHLLPTEPQPTETGIEIKISHQTETITICGIAYAFELFRHLGLGPVGPGHFFQLVGRDNGVVTVRSWDREGLARELAAAAPRADPAALARP
jgi:hypothetical protein